MSNVEKMKFSSKELEEKMLDADQAKTNVTHVFGDGFYIRELRANAGTFLVGHLQKFEQMNLFIKGKVLIFKENGERFLIEAPQTYIGEPGRKVGLVIEDMVWQNVFKTESQDIEEIEKKFFDRSEQFIQKNKAQKQVDSATVQLDFKKTIESLGFTEQSVMEQSENESDLCSLPLGRYKFKKSDSPIHGHGIFATSDIYIGEVIGPCRLQDKRTILGRYVNHSSNPNASVMRSSDGNLYYVATKNISGCVGGFDGEEILINYEQALKENLKSMEVLCQG